MLIHTKNPESVAHSVPEIRRFSLRTTFAHFPEADSLHTFLSPWQVFVYTSTSAQLSPGKCPVGRSRVNDPIAFLTLWVQHPGGYRWYAFLPFLRTQTRFEERHTFYRLQTHQARTPVQNLYFCTFFSASSRISHPLWLKKPEKSPEFCTFVLLYSVLCVCKLNIFNVFSIHFLIYF